VVVNSVAGLVEYPHFLALRISPRLATDLDNLSQIPINGKQLGVGSPISKKAKLHLQRENNSKYQAAPNLQTTPFQQQTISNIINHY
jgi:hypothetical protein